MSQLKRLSLYLAPLVLFSFLPILLSAQNMGNNQQIKVTGCVKQGNEARSYYLVGEDGRMYELWGQGVGAHVNHKVTLTGMQINLTPGEEQRRAASEKQEAGSMPYVDMKVSSVTMVGESCQ